MKGSVRDQNCKLIGIAGTCSSNLRDWNVNVEGYNLLRKGTEGN